MLDQSTPEASNGVRPVCLAVHEDEKAFWLVELNLVRPPSREWHRWQVITVNRDDKLTDWWHDLGPSGNFTGGQLVIPGLWEESVGALRELAETMRLANDTFRQRTTELEAESTLIDDMLAQFEQGERIIANKSSFGSLVSRPRNGFDTRAFHEQLRR